MQFTTHPSPTPLATLWWTSADGQGFYDMGEHELSGIAARDAAVDAAEAELLEQVGDNDAERAAILAGSWSWTALTGGPHHHRPRRFLLGFCGVARWCAHPTPYEGLSR